MAYNVPNSYQTKFNNRVKVALQEQNNPLMMAVMEQDDASAEKVKVHDLVENREAKESTGRHARTQWSDPGYDGVWIPKPNELNDPVLISNSDQLATAISIKGTSVMSSAGVLNRARIRRVLEGFYGPIISGKDGLTVTAMPSSQEIAVTTGGASGAQKMNTKKLREANKLLTEGYVPDDAERYMVLTADDNDALLSEVPATSSDFKGAFSAEVRNGKLVTMLGWKFIHLQLDNPLLTTIPDLATDGSGYRKTPFWVKPGLRVNHWQRLRTHIGYLPDLEFNLGTLAGTTLAATRTEAGMSGIILNQKG